MSMIYGVALVWACVVAALIGTAAAIEMGAIRRRIDGANGLIFLMTGLLALASLPPGFGVLWWLGGWRMAGVCTTVVALLGGMLWWTLLGVLDRAAKRER